MFVRDLNFSPVSQASKESLPLYIRELLDCIQPTTSKLESLYKEKMRIKILASTNSGNVYRREIVMLGGRKRIPRELAYIEIFLESLSVEARKEVKEGKTPFGRILDGQGIETTRKVKQVFKVRREGQILEYSNGSSRYCYGKEYSIRLLSGEKVADVIEIYFAKRRRQNARGGKAMVCRPSFFRQRV